jgi:hypothetical protein
MNIWFKLLTRKTLPPYYLDANIEVPKNWFKWRKRTWEFDFPIPDS